MGEDISAHEAVARSEQRDEHGHFKRAEESAVPSEDQGHSSEEHLSSLIHENVSVSRDPIQNAKKDDLVDVHVGNPLSRIEKLLEDIKKQKAFSFTLKGSLGIAGVAVALSLFGVLGGGKMLCEKGTTTEIGTLRSLSFLERESYTVPFISDYLNKVAPKNPRNRLVIIKNDESVVGISYPGSISLTNLIGLKVIATGDYNSCKQTLTVSNPTGIEIFK